ncbi:V-type ATP synthase subunit I [Thermococcus barophilus]|uniref:A-type ATP synthase subunit I n=1 Tax=Thermococcus barophilus (strain DSM 11836 / MP) TaxID=391623 RepID=F0LJN4_THEBM|nr:V-type ATP synthase subunit I [Thermococcus barophilus]ADT84676.1 V-type ATP synthase subunit I [Thermococcus barophilus MP]
MFRPEEMVKIELISINRYKDRLLTYLHEEGVIEIRELDVEIAQKDVPNEFYRKATSYSIGISRLVEFLETYREEKKSGIKEFFFPPMKSKRKYKYKSIEDLVKDVERFLENIEPQIKQVESRISSINTEIERIKNNMAVLELLSALNIDISYLRPTEKIEIVVGFVDRDKYSPLIEELTKTLEGKVAYVSKELKARYLVVFAILKGDYERANPILAKYAFERIEVPEGKGTPREVMREYQHQLAEKEKELTKAEKEAKELARKYYDDVVFYQELMENERDKANILNNLVRTNMTFAMLGWLPRKDVPRVVEGIKRITEGKVYINIKEPTKEELEEVPIKLKNPKFIAPFEMLTEMFGVPKYNEIDPTPILAFTYSFFFGFMLTDFMYGLLIGTVAALLVKGHKHLKDGTWKFANILLWSAFFTMLMGIFFGSYFGNILDLAGFHVWRKLDAMRDALIVLEIALAIGIFHLFIGYTLGFIVKLKNRQIKEAVLEQLSWMLIILGVILFALSMVGIGNAEVAKVVFGAGFVLFAVSEFQSDLPIPMKLLMTISDFFGFVGNWLSYARLMALALATSGIAMVVNIIVQMIWGLRIGPVPLGIAVGLVVFIGGQIFSTAINALGAFVHALRLHYVEFFGTFYSGEGKRFEPFKSRREVSELEI